MYAAHITVQTDANPRAMNMRTANESHWGRWTKTLGNSPRLDMRQSEDEHGRCQDERSDVEWKERIESRTKEVEGIVVQCVPDQAKPQKQSSYGAGGGAHESSEQQWYGNEERDPIVSEPGGPDPIDVAVRGLKDQSHDSLHRHHGQKNCGQTSGEPYWADT